MTVLALLPAGQFKGASEIARELDLPGNYLGKMLQLLAKKGLLKSRKGLGGGFSLSRLPGDINLLEVIEAFNERPLYGVCFWGDKKCPEKKRCSIHEKWEPIIEQTRELYKTTTIADINESI